MRSDIIYKIGTAEFRKRYIDPAVKSGKIDYSYKIRYGTQAFREKCMDIILGDNVPDTPDIPDTPDEPTIVWPDLITDPYPFNDSVIQFKFSKEVSFGNFGPTQTDNSIRLDGLIFSEEDKEFSFEIAVNTNRLYNKRKYWMRVGMSCTSPNPSLIDFVNGEVKTYSNGAAIENIELTSYGFGYINFHKTEYEGIIEIKGKFPVLKSGTQYQTYLQIGLYTNLENKNN